MPEKEQCEEPEQIMTYFDGVPDEILYEIVSMLSTFDLCRLAKVSQRLHRVCADERLWESVSLTKQIITFSDMELLIRSLFPIRKLDLTGSTISGIPNRPRMNKSFHMSLEKLDLTDYGNWEWYNNNSLLYILEKCRTKELILKPPSLRMLQSRLMDAISKHENLEVLSMAWLHLDIVIVDVFQTLFKGCSRLKELNFHGCSLSTTQQMRALCDNIPETVEKLVLADIHFDDYIRSSSHEVVDDLVGSYGVLFRRAKNLKSFGAPHIGHLIIPAIMDRIVQHQNLETLCLCNGDLFHPHLFDVLEKVAPKLRRIDIFLDNEFMKKELGRVPAQLETLKKAFIDIDIEISDVSKLLGK